jgi:hypothetical protein
MACHRTNLKMALTNCIIEMKLTPFMPFDILALLISDKQIRLFLGNVLMPPIGVAQTILGQNIGD